MATTKDRSMVVLEPLDSTVPHTFITPVKKIHEGRDVSEFLVSESYRDIMVFLLQLNKAMFPHIEQDSSPQQGNVQVFDLSSQIKFSNTVSQLRNLIQCLDNMIDEVPPDTGPRRFGNISFRKWIELLENRTQALLEGYLPDRVRLFNHADDLDALTELRSYFLGSFGSSQRLDYGTGHELSFLAFLGCIWKLGGFQVDKPGAEERGIVIGVIEPYLSLIRRLILTYTLEPAGSHGVWGLDDHSFLPYIFGSAQYGPPIKDVDRVPLEGSLDGAPDPGNVTNAATVAKERQKNMYFSAIGFIYDVKKGPFWEHSPTLYDISGVRAGWGKINKGMIKMFNVEVLSKLPVVQHFPFGSLFRWDRDPDAITHTPSVHTTSQPTSTVVQSGQVSAASLRNSMQEDTTIPWNASRAKNSGPFGASHLPSAGRHPSRSSNTTMIDTQPTSARGSGSSPIDRFSGNLTTRNVRESSRSAESDMSTMPPPTKAPWAQ